MCGFVGFLNSLGGPSGDELEKLARRLAATLRHRGPDDEGVWVDAAAGVALAHRRLAVIDLSAAGHQPMQSRDGRFQLVYNGEIYNHEELREALEADGLVIEWRGHSDTEILLAAIQRWGLAEALKRSRGMFALALWDREGRTLSLARDRVGEKPLYYGWQGSGKQRTFFFGSEPEAFRRHPSFEDEVDRGAMTLLMRYGYIPAPHSIYRNIFKLEPGTFLQLSVDTGAEQKQRYWDFAEIARDAQASAFAGSPEDAVDTLERLLKSSVREQMMADVPYGAFLSGGIDSSAVVSLMQAQSARPVRTFTIGFSEKGYNEAVHAKAVARHLGAEHTELYVDPSAVQEVIPKLPVIYSEPFADSSQLPTFLISALARQHVTVALSGDGGDELFGGYTRYLFAARAWRAMSKAPASLRRLAGRGLQAIPPSVYDRTLGALAASRFRLAGDKIHKGAGILGSNSDRELYLRLTSLAADPADWVEGAHEPRAGGVESLEGLDFISRMMALDGVTYLPGDILTKVDRAAMAVSLETRIPLLDPRIIGFAWSLPIEYKIRNGVSKWPLREMLYRYVPRELVERPKMGFGVPIDQWLRGSLREWAETLLDERRIVEEGYWNARVLRRSWKEHLSGRRNFMAPLWTVLMFQSWLDNRRRG